MYKEYEVRDSEIDITPRVVAKIVVAKISRTYPDYSILVYLRDSVTNDEIGFFSEAGFHLMMGNENKYRLVSTDTLGTTNYPTWFKVLLNTEVKED